jgi:hypothetical protein
LRNHTGSGGVANVSLRFRAAAQNKSADPKASAAATNGRSADVNHSGSPATSA